MKKQYCYKIYTENVNVTGVLKIVDKYFDGYTTYAGIGIWQGNTESSFIIEIITPRKRTCDIAAICKKINRLNKQICCLVTVDRVKTVFI